MSDGIKERPPMAFTIRGLMHPGAHRRPGYPLSGCGPAEPDSVSPGSIRLASPEQCSKPPSDTGVMPQKILLYRFPTEKTARSYPLAWEKSPCFLGLSARGNKGPPTVRLGVRPSFKLT